MAVVRKLRMVCGSPWMVTCDSVLSSPLMTPVLRSTVTLATLPSSTSSVKVE